MNEIKFLTRKELESGLAHILQSPKDDGMVEMIVCRPVKNERIILPAGIIDKDQGLEGDNWYARSMEKKGNPEDELDQQITIMNSRSVALLAVTRERWALAGDQLYIDMDLSRENLPSGSRIRIGTTVLEVTDQPHTGCNKFRDRYGLEAVKFVNSPEGKRWNLRGINTRVVLGGIVKVGDKVKKTF